MFVRNKKLLGDWNPSHLFFTIGLELKLIAEKGSVYSFSHFFDAIVAHSIYNAHTITKVIMVLNYSCTFIAVGYFTNSVFS